MSISKASIHCGEIWLVDFNPAKGDEIKKRRPAVVISSDKFGILDVKVVVPITEWNVKYDNLVWMTEIDSDKINMLDKKSAADAMQIKSVSIKRFIKMIGKISADKLEDIKTSIAIIIEYI